jgi:hypothetical protein
MSKVKITTKIYHILGAGIQKLKRSGNPNEQYLKGYKDCMIDMLRTEIDIKKGLVDYKDPFVINYKKDDRTAKTFTRV